MSFSVRPAWSVSGKFLVVGIYQDDVLCLTLKFTYETDVELVVRVAIFQSTAPTWLPNSVDDLKNKVIQCCLSNKVEII